MGGPYGSAREVQPFVGASLVWLATPGGAGKAVRGRALSPPGSVSPPLHEQGPGVGDAAAALVRRLDLQERPGHLLEAAEWAAEPDGVQPTEGGREYRHVLGVGGPAHDEQYPDRENGNEDCGVNAELRRLGRHQCSSGRLLIGYEGGGCLPALPPSLPSCRVPLGEVILSDQRDWARRFL